jgi:hypothetical protein
MKRGEFLKLTQEVSEHAEQPKEFTSLDEYHGFVVGWLTLRLMRRISSAAERGKKWASIEIEADSLLPEDQIAARSITSSISRTMQEEGFQTDEAYRENGEGFIRQLTVFWADGKDIYEDLELLGTIDPDYLSEPESPTIIHEQPPFRPYIVNPEP